MTLVEWLNFSVGYLCGSLVTWGLVRRNSKGKK